MANNMTKEEFKKTALEIVEERLDFLLVRVGDANAEYMAQQILPDTMTALVKGKLGALFLTSWGWNDE